MAGNPDARKGAYWWLVPLPKAGAGDTRGSRPPRALTKEDEEARAALIEPSAALPHDKMGRPDAEHPGWYRYIDPNPRAQREERRRHVELWWDDALLTVVVLIAAVQDLAFGVWRVTEPRGFLETVNNVTNGGLEESTLRLTRVGGFNQLESGVVGVLLVIYRLARWLAGQPFNGVNFQIVFLINAFGKTGAFIMNEVLLGWDDFMDTSGPLDRYFLLSRAVLAVAALVLSIFTYWHSWAWVSA